MNLNHKWQNIPKQKIELHITCQICQCIVHTDNHHCRQTNGKQECVVMTKCVGIDRKCHNTLPRTMYTSSCRHHRHCPFRNIVFITQQTYLRHVNNVEERIVLCIESSTCKMSLCNQ